MKLVLSCLITISLSTTILANEAWVNPKKWMENIPNHITLNKIAAPGCHDAQANTINYDWCVYFVNQNDMAECQNKNVTELLNIGARFLDMRVSKKKMGK